MRPGSTYRPFWASCNRYSMTSSVQLWWHITVRFAANSVLDSGNLIVPKRIPISDLVLKLLSSDGDAAKEAADKIDGMMKDVKDIATTYKKAGVTNADWGDFHFSYWFCTTNKRFEWNFTDFSSWTPKATHSENGWIKIKNFIHSHWASISSSAQRATFIPTTNSIAVTPLFLWKRQIYTVVFTTGHSVFVCTQFNPHPSLENFSKIKSSWSAMDVEQESQNTGDRSCDMEWFPANISTKWSKTAS